MYMAVVRMKLDAGRLDEAKKRWSEQLKPQLTEVDGLTGSFFVTDEKSGEALSVGVWESVEQARAFEGSAQYGTLVKLFDDMKTGSPSRTLYEFADVDRLDFGGARGTARPSEEAPAPMH